MGEMWGWGGCLWVTVGLGGDLGGREGYGGGMWGWGGTCGSLWGGMWGWGALGGEFGAEGGR